MFSISIYHYLYRITNLVEQKHYYGIRTSKNTLPQNDLGKRYFSSSRDKDFRKDQRLHPENYRYKIIIVSDSRQRVAELEVKIHQKFNVGVNPKFYNNAIQTSTSFDPSGKAVMRDYEGNIVSVFVTDNRIASGELVGATKGFLTMRDHDGTYVQVIEDDPRIKSGELVGTTKGVRFICNPVTQQNTTLPIGEDLPEGFEYGRLNVRTTKGKMFIYNPESGIEKIIDKDTEIPSGWVAGSISGSLEKGSVAIHNFELGKIKFLKPGETLPMGWEFGFLPGKFIHNKVLGVNKKIPINDLIPDGWEIGRMKAPCRGNKGNRFIFNLELKQNKQLRPGEILQEGWKYGMRKFLD